MLQICVMNINGVWGKIEFSFIRCEYFGLISALSEYQGHW
jgi:hypothetical protein